MQNKVTTIYRVLCKLNFAFNTLYLSLIFNSHYLKQTMQYLRDIHPKMYLGLLLSICLLPLFSNLLFPGYFSPEIFYLALLFPMALIANYTSWAKSIFSSPLVKLISFAGISALLLLAYLRSINNIVSFQWIDIQKLFSFNPKAYLGLFLCIVSIHGLHLMLYHLRKIISLPSIKDKAIFYGTTYLFFILICNQEWKAFVAYSLAFGVYFLLMDLFVDRRQSSLIWLVVWTIILGSFLSLSILEAYNGNLASFQEPLKIINAVSLFSLSFIFSAMLYMIYAIINSKNQFLPIEWDFNFNKSAQLRNRIQLSILLTLLFSFLAIGWVSIYYFNQSMPEGVRMNFQSDFIQALFNTYVFLFMIGFAISIVLSDYIRNPLIDLGKTLKAVQLNKTNKKIDWNGNDEIAYLISEYNEMINKLEANAHLFAKIERDSAWREMAKQVAHEIKNPLTPMKLSLQHLQRTIQLNPENNQALTLRMCDTLMNQVENLHQIANEFSNFASLPKTDNQRVLLNDLVESIHDLFRNRNDMDIHLIEPIDDILVYADKNQLMRILNNIVKNSIQAIPEDRKGEITLRLFKDQVKAIIEIEDNGIGISIDQQEQIFKPQFTTKSSGSGLGLAISANIVDSMGGTIYFNSVEGKGSSFFVELPLIRTEYSESLERVSLD